MAHRAEVPKWYMCEAGCCSNQNPRNMKVMYRRQVRRKQRMLPLDESPEPKPERLASGSLH